MENNVEFKSDEEINLKEVEIEENKNNLKESEKKDDNNNKQNFEIGIKDNKSKSEEEKHEIIWEYYFYTVIIVLVVFYSTIKLGIICHDLAKKHNYKLDGLSEGYSFLGGYRDTTDYQWRNYRKFLVYIIGFFSIFVITQQLLKRFCKYMIVIKIAYLIFGCGYSFYLHRIRFIYLNLILLGPFLLTYLYRFLGKVPFMAIIWIYGCGMKAIGDIFEGFPITIFDKLPQFFKETVLSWNMMWGLVLLRVISFCNEYAWVIDQDFTNNKLRDLEQIRGHCPQCKEDKYCLTALKFIYVNKEDFSYINYLIYVFYPPVYLSGPTIMFHSFIFQLNNHNVSKHNSLLLKPKILYTLKCIAIFIGFEIFNHYIYVNAILTNEPNQDILNEFVENNSLYYYLFLAFNNLVFIFMKYCVIWSFARLFSWWDGILTENNMNRCIYNNYSFEGFWRQWHRSFNIWLIRYMYIPLGGKKFKFLNTFLIFSFVALWHDLWFNLLVWAWCIYLCLIPEIIIKRYFTSGKRKALHKKVWFRYLRSWACSIDILLLITANLIGFGFGNTKLDQGMMNIFKRITPLNFILITLYFIPLSFTMFFIRELEENHGIKKNY